VHPEVKAGFESRLVDRLPSLLFELVQQRGNSSIHAVYSVAARSYARDRVCLVGDGGAVFPPFAGSGVLRAVPNATSLADALADAPTVDDGLRRWVRLRSRSLLRSCRSLNGSSGAPCSTCPTSPPCQPRRPTTGCPQPIPGSWSRFPTCDRVTGEVLHRFIPVDEGGAERFISRYTPDGRAPAGTLDSALGLPFRLPAEIDQRGYVAGRGTRPLCVSSRLLLWPAHGWRCGSRRPVRSR
jgi:hypothetical protein